MLYALCYPPLPPLPPLPPHFTLCPKPSAALCSMPYALCPMFIVLIPILNRCQPCYLFKQIPERLRIRIPHIIHHFIDILKTSLQAPLRSFYFYSLYIFQHRIIRSLFKPAFKTPAT